MRSVISRADRGRELEARGAKLAGLTPAESMPAVNAALMQVLRDLLGTSETAISSDHSSLAQMLRTVQRTMRHLLPAVEEKIALLPPEDVAEVVRSVLENFRPLIDVGVIQLPAEPSGPLAIDAAPPAEEVPDALDDAGSDARQDQPATA